MSPGRDVIAGVRTRAGLAISMARLPRGVARFLSRARKTAVAEQDDFSVSSAIRPLELAELLRLARGRRAVVELGTGTGWSTIALALADPARRVVTYDPAVREQRELYLALVDDSVRARIEFRAEPDASGPRPGETTDFLFVDSAHDRPSVLAAFAAWRDSLEPGALVAFHDYDNPAYPGVREAVQELGLTGSLAGSVFAWRSPETP